MDLFVEYVRLAFVAVVYAVFSAALMYYFVRRRLYR